MTAHDDLRRLAKRANEMEPEWKWREWALDSPSTVGELIDAFSPQAILALLDERDALERERDDARSEAASHLAALAVVAQKRDEARAEGFTAGIEAAAKACEGIQVEPPEPLMNPHLLETAKMVRALCAATVRSLKPADAEKEGA